MSTVRARKSLTSQAVVCLQVGEADEEAGTSQEAMDMAWPSGARKRITYVLLAPIVFPLWLTLPDTRSPRGKSVGVGRGGARAEAGCGLRRSVGKGGARAGGGDPDGWRLN